MTVRRVASFSILALLLALVSPGLAVGRTMVSGHVPAVARTLRATGRLKGETKMDLTIGLPLRNAEELKATLDDLYNSGSTNYHHFLNATEFAGRFAPTSEQYRAVEMFARSNRLTVVHTHSNRLLLDIRASAAEVEKAFNVQLQTYARPDGSGEFFAPDKEPSVAGEVALLDVSGLSNFRLPQPLFRHRKTGARNQETTRPDLGSASGGSYLGNDFRAAYAPGVNLTGAGQVVALLEFDGYYPADIATYESRAGLSAVPLQNVLLDSYNGAPTSNGNAEVSLDIEMAISMAPGLSKVMVYEAGPSGSPNDILNRMATDNQAKEIACSWTWSGGPSAATDQILLEMAAQGQSFFCASGDSTAYGAGALDSASSPSAPSDSPYVTSVGATTLTTSGPAGARVSETVWNWGNGEGSSGGVSAYYSMPTWQQGVSMTGNGGSATMRNIPDVAMAGDNIYVVYGNGSSGVFGGTSCAAPLWAGFIALANQQALAYGVPAVGFLNPALYAVGKGSNYTAAFNDVTTGNNTNASSPAGYFAMGGYDLCTGWGTPSGAALINLLAAPADPLGISPSTALSASGAPGGPFNVSSWNFVLTNSSAASLKWAAASSAGWLTLSLGGGTLAPGTFTLTATLNSAAAVLGNGSYSAVLSFTNLTSGDVFTRLITLNVVSQLVQNGGFEAGTLAGWTTGGNVLYTFSTVAPAYVHSGNDGLQFGPYNGLGSLSQTIPTVPGKSYVVSVWLNNPQPGGAPNQFNMTWGGARIFGATNLGNFDWTNLQFIVTASTSATALQLSARNDPGYFGVDDISVVPFVAPALRTLAKVQNTMQLSLTTTPGLIYQLQYVTDLTQTNWVNMGLPFSATDSVTTFTDPTASDVQRFYRVIVHP